MYILLVDDNDEIADNLKLVLEIEGFQVRAASSVSAALKEIRRELPGLILADVVMPGQNGFDLFQMIRVEKEAYHIPFFFLSAAATSEDLDRSQRYGADGYITKPFALNDLLAIVRRHIHN